MKATYTLTARFGAAAIPAQSGTVSADTEAGLETAALAACGLTDNGRWGTQSRSYFPDNAETVLHLDII